MKLNSIYSIVYVVRMFILLLTQIQRYKTTDLAVCFRIWECTMKHIALTNASHRIVLSKPVGHFIKLCDHAVV